MNPPNDTLCIFLVILLIYTFVISVCECVSAPLPSVEGPKVPKLRPQAPTQTPCQYGLPLKCFAFLFYMIEYLININIFIPMLRVLNFSCL